MLNIAEGFDADSDKSFLNFLHYSFRSASEVRSILYIALDLDYISKEQFDDLFSKLITIKKLIGGLLNYLINKNLK